MKLNNVLQPDIRPWQLPSGKWTYRLWQKYQYDWTPILDSTKRHMTVPEGFLLDLASVPRWLTSITGLTPDGAYRPGTLLHDFGCEYEGKLPYGSYEKVINGIWRDQTHIRWSRESLDRLAGRVNRETGVPKLQRRMFYCGIRVGARWSKWWNGW